MNRFCIVTFLDNVYCMRKFVLVLQIRVSLTINKIMKLLKFIAIASLTIATTSCEKEHAIIQEGPAEIPVSHIEKINNLGYDTSSIVVNTELSMYIVEGDIGLPITFIDQVTLNTLGNKQRTTTIGQVDCWKVKDIKIRHSPGFPEYLRTALEEAVKEWNNTTGTNLRFRYVDDEQDIYIQTSSNLGGNLGTAVPAGLFETTDLKTEANFGRPGNQIYISTTIQHDWNTWVSVIMHELGHTVGLGHTDKQLQGTHIEGTPRGDDPYSVMHSNWEESQWNPKEGERLSFWDKRAIQTLYGNCN